jgi:hypothetical protein
VDWMDGSTPEQWQEAGNNSGGITGAEPKARRPSSAHRFINLPGLIKTPGIDITMGGTPLCFFFKAELIFRQE